MNKEQIESEIAALKNLLEQSDHVPNKISESIVLALNGATAVTAIPMLLAAVASVLSEYQQVIKDRAAWRERINALEAELDSAEIQ